MRRPGYWTIAGIALAALGVSVATWGFTHAARTQIWDPARKAGQTMTGVGAAITLAGLVMAVLCYLVLRKRNQLASGVDLLARWRVGMLDWAAFRRRDAARDALFPSLRNRLRLPAELPPEGMEIRVGPDALLVGDACYGLGVGFMPARGTLVDVSWVEGQPGMLEFVGHIRGKNTSKLTVARIPVPAASRAEADRLLDHFRQAIDPRRREGAHARFPLHFQAAEGDAGEAEAAREEDRRRNWRASGFAFLFIGAAMLGTCLWGISAPIANLAAYRILTVVGGLLAAAGVIALVVSTMRRD
jgi:hypothetical protein